jgi:hypothetical protein
MTKEFNQRELTQIKRIAQNVDADYQSVRKLDEKIAELTKKKNMLQQGIDEMEAPVMRKTGGFKSTDIYMKTIIPQFNEDGTPKTDKDGRQLKVTKYILRYPESIVPNVHENRVPEHEDEMVSSDMDNTFNDANSPVNVESDLNVYNL